MTLIFSQFLLNLIFVGKPVVLGLSNIQILMMLLKLNIIWMAGFVLVGN
uniref:Uncharacterized protein n=1 Tax=Rhizophora mucronata TaxID=61149 RepID=A0A2P2R4Z5_RHIMU